MMKISIRDYRGVERCDIELDKIALIAGRNEQGKSCVAEAARAALCGMPIPIAGVLKKDAKMLVRDGADGGHVKVTDGESTTMVSWPATTANTDGEAFKCSDYASGFLHLLDHDQKMRASVLAQYIDSVPTQEDIETAARDAGYQDGAIAKIWDGVRGGGYDATYKRARDYTVLLKGQWQEATGEKYGTKKGADWAPNVADRNGDLVELGGDRNKLVDKVNAAEQAVLDTAGAVAVSDAEVSRLKRVVRAAADSENRIALNDELSALREKLDSAKSMRSQCPEDAGKAPDVPQIPCPECGAVLCVDYSATGPLALKPYVAEEGPKKVSGEVLERRASLDESIKEYAADINQLEGRINVATNQINAASAAETSLKEIEAAPKLDEVTTQLAKDEFSHAQALVSAFDANARASKLHGDLVKNEKLLAILAPDGLRRRKLVEKLNEFNARLAAICASAAWPVVRLDEKLDGHYGTRPVWAASKSGQWRARAVLQIALAQIDGSAAVILDEADMLDKRGRNGLFKALLVADISAIVCMTFNSPDKVPDLAAAGLGQSYWIDGGSAEAIG